MTADEVPWTTAVEYVDQYLDELDVDPDSTTAEKAREFAERYDGAFSTPRGIAVGAIYFGSLLNHGPKLNQAEICEATGCGAVTISKNYREIAEREGYPIGRSDRQRNDEEPDDPGLLARILGRWLA